MAMTSSGCELCTSRGVIALQESGVSEIYPVG